MQNIDREIAEKYGMEVKSATPFKDVLILNTSMGKKVLRKNPLSTDRILFVHAAKEHLYNNNFTSLDRYLCSVEGNPYITLDGVNYCVSEAVEGIECNFDSKQDIISASRTLARIHKASKGFAAPEGARPRDELGKIPFYFVKRLDEIKKLKKVAKRGKTKFDYLFLDHADYYYNLGDNAIESITNSKYEQIVKEAQEEKTFCHHDYTHHNIICGKDRVSVINFDFCCYELRVYDLANLIRRKMRKCNWNIDEARLIIDEYRAEQTLSYDELVVMKTILQFPQKFWRVVNKYYNSKRSWSEKSYISKLYEVINEKEDHRLFIQSFDTLIK